MRLSLLTALFTLASFSQCHEQQPLVNTQLGTLGGLHLPKFNQDAFLGIPFALPPTKNLRFARPQPYNVTWKGVKEVTSYGKSCYGMSSFSDGLPLDEDCLFLNIVRPAESSGKLLPVFIWIHGGGWIGGGSADPRYNLSYLVSQSVEMGKPMIGISLNYRMLGFGFLSGGDMESTDFNAALKDQRLALQWIHDNIAAFGGDPGQVTLAGESAGAWSTGFQLVGHGGDAAEKGLFQRAILQETNLLAVTSNEFYTKRYNELAGEMGCDTSPSKLECLREIPPEKLFDYFVGHLLEYFWDPTLDGDFLQKEPWELMENGQFAKVDILIGTNMDECTCPTHGPRGFFNTTEQLRDFLINGAPHPPEYRILSPLLPPELADRLLSAYPDSPSDGCPFKTGPERFEEHGYQYKRGAAMIGDWLMQAGRRHVAQQFADVGKKVYSYHFEQEPVHGVEFGVVEEHPVGVAHFTDVAYIFNIPDPELVNHFGVDPGHVGLGELMSRMWISFVTTRDPNNHGLDVGGLKWPLYKREGGENIIFKANETRIEPDDFRKEGMQFWAETWEQTSKSMQEHELMREV
ncbi:alpha/beta-hydrolase [Mytilinidion resinicola]|uniref:Carboxylic ester hydrolase n=1 Tax=Mytilinidion resinicola TaxID=574789 RepID=A0A6A6YHR9_9PEZI|nr:alpha/beta-hydrolase [Mytilinidion resinicola]KAF2808128.1 alpha/beta-hydrolase [Mytilinidion resinicola]